MEYVIAVVGFFGGWLLVAGPLTQAWLELREEEFDHDEMESVAASIPKPPRVSTWWWLLPPVAWIKTRRGQTAYRAAVMKVLSPEQREQTLNFLNKANAWLVVAAGAYLIAVKETWESVEKFEIWIGVFWILIVVLPIAFVVVLAARAVHLEQALGHEKPPPRPRRQRPSS